MRYGILAFVMQKTEVAAAQGTTLAVKITYLLHDRPRRGDPPETRARKANASAKARVHEGRRTLEYPRSIRGVRLALLFRSLANGRTKISFRSLGDVDVSALAGRFGGGGHRRAAGASVAGDLADVQEMVLKAAREVLEVGG